MVKEDQMNGIAHVRQDGESLVLHDLGEHNAAVSRLAAAFAKEFGAAP